MAKPSPLSPADLDRQLPTLRAIMLEISALDELSEKDLAAILRRHPRDGQGIFSKNHLVAGYHRLRERGVLAADEELLHRIQMRPVRTLSGVTIVTVLTKPWSCPGQCIFCPDVEGMPKSYLPDEPGAMRAAQNDFDPYAQTAGRIAALQSNGHPVDKIELLVLGGTWSSYPRDYQEWFLTRCLDAMNEAGLDRDALGAKRAQDDNAQATMLEETRRHQRENAAATLEEAQSRNENARCRNVGLVLETRPDHITPEEVRHLRALGATKIQMGAQSLSDGILRLNHRGHTVENTRRAMTLLRAAGFKLVLHWMPNLLGATPESDLEDFTRLFDDPDLKPDEIKIYPTTLLTGTELFQRWEKGAYHPYDDATLTELVIACKERTPRYCRINRIYRDIPSQNVVAGCKMTNLRQHVHQVMSDTGRSCQCLRCREVKEKVPDEASLQLNEERYRTRAGEERFLSFDDAHDRCAGYLRLALPEHPGFAGDEDLGLPELEDAALVREIHVYGRSLPLEREGEPGKGNGKTPPGGASQHRGLGRRLLKRAEDIAREGDFPKMAIIASVGTREYYRKRGYRLQGTYMVKSLPSTGVS